MPNYLTLILLFNLAVISHSLHCNETCGGLQISFPFYLNSPSCGWSRPDQSGSNSSSSSSQFQLMCINSTALYLIIGTQNYRVLEFDSDGVIVDFPGLSSVCRAYNDLNSFGFNGNAYLSISTDNTLGLYDCEDLYSSVCKANCEGIDLPGCDKNPETSPSCCYPLSDHSVWRVGDGFSVFAKYECRGFSCWAVPRGLSSGRRGVKLEWALPRYLSKEACDVNAHSVNSTTVKDGIRCVCDDGFSGDGFANATGCLKSCFKDGKEAYGKGCDTKRRKSQRKIIVLVGILTSVLAVIVLAGLVFVMQQFFGKPPINDNNKPRFRSSLSFQKACRGRLFALAELEQATNGFADEQILVELYNGSVYSGLLGDGSRIAVHRVHCQNEKDLLLILTQIELLSSIIHRHMAHIIGCCIDSGYTPMVVYEFPENGTLAQHIDIAETKDQQIIITSLDWYKRLTIAAQISGTLAFLQHEISTPVYHYNLKTSCIFLDREFSVKLACFELINPSNTHSSDVYDLGMVLLEIISGSKHFDLPAIALEKIRDGKLEEIVDPLLHLHEQPPYRKEQIEIMADVATRCLLFGGAGEQGNSVKLGMLDVARELVHLAKESMDGGSKKGPALEETLSSDSSLLQMVSMSPENYTVSDSAYFSLPFKKHVQM